MSSEGCQVSLRKKGVKNVRESQKWSDLVDDSSSEERMKMDMSSLAAAIDECKTEGGLRGGGKVFDDDDDITCEESHARAIAESERRLSSEIVTKGFERLKGGERQPCTIKKSKNSNDHDNKVSEVSDVEMDLCDVAGKVAQRQRLHHVGDGVTSLCQSIQFVKVGNLARPVKYRHKLAKEENVKGKSDSNRWLRAALVENPNDHSAASKVLRHDNRSRSEAGEEVERQRLMIQRAPWERRRENWAAARRPSSPLVPISSRPAMMNPQPLRNPPPLSSLSQLPFASLQRRHDREKMQSSPLVQEPSFPFPEERVDHDTMELSWRSRGDRPASTSSIPFVTSPLPLPNFLPFYRRQKQSQIEKALNTISNYALHYDVPPHLYSLPPPQPLYDNDYQFRKMIHDPHFAVNSYLTSPPHQSNPAPLINGGRSQFQSQPQSRSFVKEVSRAPPARLPPNGGPYGRNDHSHNLQQQQQQQQMMMSEVQTSSGGVRRDDVNHSTSYRSPLYHADSEEPHYGDIDLLKRGILNRTLRD